MQHCTPEQLALAALGEPLPRDDEAHLAGCAECRAEVRSLRRSVEVLAVPGLAAPGAPVAPPPSVWGAIAAATGVSATPRTVQDAELPVETADVVPLAPARRRRSLRGRLLVAAASLLVGLGLGAGLVALRDTGSSGQTVAAAPLRPVGPDGASGSATVLRRGDAQVLEVSLRARALSSGYYEVWLADADLKRMVAVGILHDGKGDLELPPEIDLSTYRVVDVSDEPLDGDPAHSAVSVARGRLS